jgi:hypothetical protein
MPISVAASAGLTASGDLLKYFKVAVFIPKELLPNGTVFNT